MSGIDEVTFLRKLQRLLEEGDFVATYKFALLQALADLSVENDSAPDGTLSLSLAQIAEKFIEYYWRQARPYRGGEALLQNSGRQAAVLKRVAEAHTRYEISLAAARRDALGWAPLLRNVANTVRTMPLWKLQMIGGQPEEFLYRRAGFDGTTITLTPGVAKCFRAFHPFIVNMVRGAWVEHLLRIRSNRSLVSEQGDLSEFLFGSERKPLDSYRKILREHQSSRCFYCGRAVRKAGALDHFIPWTRYPVDLGHNFVFVHPQCNGRKRDYLAHPVHLARWRKQNMDIASELATPFDAALLQHDVERSRHVAYWAYEQGELARSRVWLQSDDFEDLGPEWRQALSAQFVMN